MITTNETLLTAKETIVKAGLDWTLEGKPIHVDGREVEGYQAVTRLDNNQVLSVMSGRYNIIQNVEAFDFFDSVVGEGQAIYDQVGSANSGRKVWIMAKLNAKLFIDTRPDDVSERNVMLVNSHDGSNSLLMMFVAKRLVCNNQLAATIQNAKVKASIRHTKNYKVKREQVQEILKLSNAYFDKLGEVLSYLDRQNVNEAVVDKFVAELFPVKDENEDNTRTVNMRNKVIDLFENGKGNQGRTKFDLLQGVTEYVDHHRSIRDEDSRLVNGLLGSGQMLKERAFELLMA